MQGENKENSAPFSYLGGNVALYDQEDIGTEPGKIFYSYLNFTVDPYDL